MDGLIWVLLLVAVVNFFGSRKKKQQQEESKRRAAQAQQEQAAPENPLFPALSGAPRSRQADPRFPDLGGGYAKPQADPRFPDLDEHPSQAAQAADPRFPESTPMQQEQESAARRARQRASEQELAAAKRAAQERLRQRQQQPMQARVTPAAYTPIESQLHDTQGSRHALEPSFISGHAHTESSLTGAQEDCPPPRTFAQAKEPQFACVQPMQAPNTPTAEALGRLTRSRNALVQGVLMREVLGKPKALRRM